ncbi:MAG: MBL fold metallo-hydrolase [Candidatus Aenigmatarchaeota archaeon]
MLLKGLNLRVDSTFYSSSPYLYLMVKLVFYGGVNEIGGNKILIEDEETRIFLDFGMSFAQSSKYFSEFLQPRVCSGLSDLIELGIIPDLKGIYRNDLLAHEGKPLTEKPMIDAVFLSHAHADHSWNISLLHPEIPIFCGETTKLMLKAAQETSRGLYYEDFYIYRECFVDRRKKPEKERNFKTFRTGDKIKIKDIEVEPIHVDHSIPGAYGFLVHTSSGTIAYSGDIRMHGPKKEMSEDFIQAARKERSEALILEGTNIDNRMVSLTENQVFKTVTKLISQTKKLVLCDFPIRDVDRLKTFFEAGRKNGRKFVTNMKQAYLIELLNKEDKKLELPSLDEFQIFLHKSSWGNYEKQDYYKWQQKFLDYPNVIKAEDLAKQQEKFVLYMEFFDLTELLDIKPSNGSLFIHSLTEPFNEEMALDFNKMLNWLNKFKIPFKHVHASGHADISQLKKIAEGISPKKIFPIHTERPDLFINLTKKAKVIIPEVGRGIEVF